MSTHSCCLSRILMSYFACFSWPKAVRGEVKSKPGAWRVMRYTNFKLRVLQFDEGSGTAGMLLLSTTALLPTPVQMPLLDSYIDRSVSVRAQLDSSEEFKSGGSLWRHRPAVEPIKLSAYCWTCWTMCSSKMWVDEGRLQTRCMLSMQALL
jgi:hypothetical protein